MISFLKINYQKRIFGLDLMRAAAIIIVLLGHSGHFLNNTAFEGFPFVNLLDGVELFFVLSGYLIGSILLKECDKNIFDFKALLNFWKRRWFRTLPNYYFILCINILLAFLQIVPSKKEAINWKFFFFVQNFYTPFVDFFWESWSLSVEEWFYIFLGITLTILTKLLNVKHAYLLASFILLTVPVFYRIYLSHKEVDYFWWDVTFRKVVLCRLDSIGYGVLGAWIHYYFPDTWTRWRTAIFIVGIILFILVSNLEVDPGLFFFKTYYFTLTSFICTLWLPFLSMLNIKSTPITKLISYISVISYSLYLLNLSIIEQVIRIYSSANGIVNYILFWALNFILATLLYRYFEKPLMDLRDKS